jgi:hypothetical protein
MVFLAGRITVKKGRYRTGGTGMITSTGDGRMDADYCRISADKTGAAAGVGSQHEENDAFAEDMGLDLERTYTDKRPVGVQRGRAAGL